jgi:hypothetical protein
MKTFEVLRYPAPTSNVYATAGNITAFPKRVVNILKNRGGNPKLKIPSKNPLVLGIILQGPFIKNFAIPITLLRNDVKNVRRNSGCLLTLVLSDMARHSSNKV